MPTDTMLDALKIDLRLTTDAYDTRLYQYLDFAEAEIRREGAALDLSDPEDAQIVVMYAAWLWRQNDGAGGTYTTSRFGADQMPRMIRYALNNHIFQQKIRQGGVSV